ncbi:MAG: hypothetical protein WBG38_05745, partial [Nodosilinea sp.]
LESESGLVKREADKSYKLGTNRPQPDLLIEVVVTSGGIDKLEPYGLTPFHWVVLSLGAGWSGHLANGGNPEAVGRHL